MTYIAVSPSLSPRCAAQRASLSGAVRFGCWCWGASQICSIARSSAFIAMLYCLRLQHCVDLCLGGLLLFLAVGLQQVEAASSAEMIDLNWKPFIYGGMASIVAEFGKLRDAPPHTDIPTALHISWAAYTLYFHGSTCSMQIVFFLIFANGINIYALWYTLYALSIRDCWCTQFTRLKIKSVCSLLYSSN